MRRALLFLALSMLAACSDDPAETRVPAGAPSTSAPTVSDREVPDPLGMGSWEAARTVAGKPNELLVILVGGPEYKPDNPCSVRYDPRVEETADEVKLVIAAFTPDVKTPANFGCNSMGHYREMSVVLKAPLGSRRLREVKFDRVQPVWDGNLLYEPTWMPDGFKLGSEGGGRGEIDVWSRTFAAERGTSDGACVPGPQALTLSQYPSKPVYPNPAARQVSLRGTTGQFESHEPDGKSLSWNEAGQAFEISTLSGCVGDPPTDDAVLIRFAEGLRKP